MVSRAQVPSRTYIVAMNRALMIWNMNIHIIVNAEVALEGRTLYCHEVIVAAVCMQIIAANPAKIKVLRLK